jgi:hypothetical protein
VDTALKALRLQVRLNLRRTVSAVRPRPPCEYWRDRPQRPACDCRARMHPSHPICGSACAPCPRRGGSCSRRSSRRSSLSSARPCPSGHAWRAAAPIPAASGLDRFVLLLCIALLGHRHNRGVNDLTAARNVACGLEMPAKTLEQLVDQPRLRQLLAKQPDRGCAGSSSRSRKRMNDMRSRMRYSVCSSERLCSDCSTTILNFRIAA